MMYGLFTWLPLHISNQLYGKPRRNLEHPDLELLWIEFYSISNRPLLLGCCYRPPNSTMVFLENWKLRYSLRDPDWDIVHRKTSQLTSRNFFIEDVSPGLLPASSVHDTKYKKPRPFIGAQNHTNGITPETVTKFFPKSQITFPIPTLNSTGSQSTFGSCLRRCPSS